MPLGPKILFSPFTYMGKEASVPLWIHFVDCPNICKMARLTIGIWFDWELMVTIQSATTHLYLSRALCFVGFDNKSDAEHLALFSLQNTLMWSGTALCLLKRSPPITSLSLSASPFFICLPPPSPLKSHSTDVCWLCNSKNSFTVPLYQRMLTVKCSSHSYMSAQVMFLCGPIFSVLSVQTTIFNWG